MMEDNSKKLNKILKKALPSLEKAEAFPQSGGPTYTPKANEITVESLESWKMKFHKYGSLNDLLARNVYEVCPVCYKNIKKQMVNGNVAVLCGCTHLFCLNCIATHIRIARSK